MNKKDIIIGFVSGIITAAIGLLIYIFIFSDDDLKTSIQNALAFNFFGKLVTLGALLNIGLFFIFLKKNQDEKARGVLLATVVIAIIFLIKKFI